ncbi:MAG: anaerobic ribonucleoside-triphosphate reductase activating protein [Candidatus Bathyarchaeota archaeon]|nr:MAG: anaerobic ribonucleoside-triphosphate reductase activating protein [Candidatus Bathyarchaeota archaeon]
MKLPDIKGFIDLSLVDWDGKVSAVIFLPYCNFRCPFCYNTALVTGAEEMPTVPSEEVVRYLSKNRKWLDGVAITGGEPTIHGELPALCKRIKELGMGVKLDTNGTNSVMVKELMADKLVDYIALDVKAPLTVETYSRVAGVNMAALMMEVENTAALLMKSSLDYEFRTTLVPTIHSKTDLERICSEIGGCRRYVLQNLKENVATLDPKFGKATPFSREEMEEFLASARKVVPNTYLR